MRKKLRSAMFLPCFFMLCSCVSQPDAGEKRPFVYITNSAKFFLLPPEKIEKPIDMAQFISASYGEQNFYVNAWVRADFTGMEITLINELGSAMGELSYFGGDVRFSSPVFPKSLKPEYIAADFQLCFYEPSALSEALESSGLTFVIDEEKRLILQDKNVVIEIEKKQTGVKLTNYLRGYTYTLEGEFS